jgi:hypothetical protein
MLGPFPMGQNNPVEEYLLLEQTLANNLAMNDMGNSCVATGECLQ